jgi:putative ABC transport system permease protein
VAAGLTPLLRALGFGYWRRHRLRGVLVVASLALGVAAWSATHALSRAAHEAGQQAASPLGGQADFCVSSDDSGVPRQWAEQFRRIPGVEHVRPLTLRHVRIGGPRPIAAVLLGVDLAAETGSQTRLSPDAIQKVAAARIAGLKPVLVGHELANEIGKDGDTIELLVDGHTVHVTTAGTILDAAGPAAVLAGHVLVIDISDMAKLLGQPDQVSRLDVTLAPGADPRNVRRDLSAITRGSARVRTADALNERTNDMFAGLNAGFSLCGIGALIAGLLLIHNVLAVGVAERRHDAGVLRSMGATQGQIFGSFLIEATIFGLVGGVLGGPTGFLISRLGAGPIGGILSDVFLPVGPIATRFNWMDAADGTIAGVVTALVAAIIPSLQGATVSPKSALRRLPDEPERVVAWRSYLPAIVLAAIGIILNQYGSAWLGLFALTLAGLAASPPITRLLARIVRPAARQFASIGANLAIDNYLRWPTRYGLATATLAGGAALLVQTAGVIRSNEAAVQSWLDSSVVGDLFVTSGGPLSASGQTLPMKTSLGDSLFGSNVYVTPFRFRHVDWRQNGGSARILAVLLDTSTYCKAVCDRYPNLPDQALYRQLSEQPGTVLVSHNFSALHGLGTGDTLTLPVLGGKRDLRILGTVADYSCTQGTVLLDGDRDGAGLADGLADVFSVSLPPGADAEKTRDDLLRTPEAAENALCVLTHDELRQHTLGMVRRLYGVAAAQLAVVALVSVLGVAAAMTISVMQRRGELGLLRSLGATRGQLLWAMLGEAIGLGSMATLVGVVLGLPLEWATVKWALLAETGFAFTPQFPAWEIIVVALASILGSAAAGLIPALTAARMDAAATVTVE